MNYDFFLFIGGWEGNRRHFLRYPNFIDDTFGGGAGAWGWSAFWEDKKSKAATVVNFQRDMGIQALIVHDVHQ